MGSNHLGQPIGFIEVVFMLTRRSAREYGFWLGMLSPGFNNDITDVPGVCVGHVSLMSGEGPLLPGKGPVRTGVTAILPHGGNLYRHPCKAGIYVYNGFGKSLGVPYISETGVLNSPILLTNTLSVNDVAQGVLTHLLRQNPEIGNDAHTPNVVVFECDDSYLNDVRGRHVKPWDALLAISRAVPGPISQGNVGAGVGMSCFQLKGGIGSSSRKVCLPQGTEYMIGVLALANFGLLEDLWLAGVPLGWLLLREWPDGDPGTDYVPGSLIFVGLTDAPLTSPQLEKLAKRTALGQARTGSLSRTGSGDFALMASTTSEGASAISDWELDVFYQAVVEASAESIWNALFYAETMVGRDGHRRQALPIGKALQFLRNWQGGVVIDN